MGSAVSLVRTGFSEAEIKNSIRKAIGLIGFDLKDRIRTVTIKVNLCYYYDAATGETTDPLFVAAVIDYVRERWGNDVSIRVVEADATAMRTKYAFLMLGYEKLAREKKVELFNLLDDTLDEQEVHVNGRTIKLKIPSSLMKSDLFISTPKLKTHSLTGITCAYKNMFGCIGARRKVVYHPVLNETIVGVNKILHPHLIIVDGLVALRSLPIRLGLVMASVDGFSIDWTASKILGYNPSSIRFLKVALKEKIGDPHEISILGESVDVLRRSFPKQSYFYSRVLPKAQKKLVTIYEKITGDVVPLQFKT